MFGFGKVAGYEYFTHVEKGLARRFREASTKLVLHVAESPPTASIQRRARHVAEEIFRCTQEDEGPIHLIGHSSGGLDARLVASSNVRSRLFDGNLKWGPRLKSIVTINTPHYGT